MIVNSGHLSCLNVLKRFGPGNAAPLSFPMPGWTLTVDLPIEHGLDRLCDALDEQVSRAGGRVYLAKDSRLSAATFRQMYPRLDDFLAVRREVDPAGHLQLRPGPPTGNLGDRSVINSVGVPQSLLLLGGTSDIAMAVARRYAGGRGCGWCWPPGRPSGGPPPRPSCGAGLRGHRGGSRRPGPRLARRRPSTPPSRAGTSTSRWSRSGCSAMPERAWTDADHALELAEVNYAAPVHLGVLLAGRMRAQAHGWIVAMSSVAGERVRRSNFVYGSTKAGLDGFFLGLGEALREHGVRVLVVRPGFVRSKMTEGLDRGAAGGDARTRWPRPSSTAISAKRELIWVPAPMRAVMSGLRHVPRPLFRKLPI